MLCSNLRGPESSDPFFQKLPQVYVMSYQGSESSTSEGIRKAKSYCNCSAFPFLGTIPETEFWSFRGRIREAFDCQTASLRSFSAQ